MNKKRGLGTPLAALLADAMPASVASANAPESLSYLPVTALQPGKYQPRQAFADVGLAELAASIKTQGVLQAIIVRPIAGSDNYEIVAGERRWRAAQLAELSVIPALIKDLHDEAAMAIALIENIQRELLNPVETALAFQRLLDEFGLTHQQIANTVGKSRTSITNSLRLLNLAPQVKDLLAQGAIEMGHARALLTLPIAAQCQLASVIAERQLSVRQTEQRVQNLLRQQNHDHSRPAVAVNKEKQLWQGLQDDLAKRLGLTVRLTYQDNGQGKIIINYKNLAEVADLLSRLELLPPD
jgi:ParB family chromosome partitioning protein